MGDYTLPKEIPLLVHYVENDNCIYEKDIKEVAKL